MQNKTTVPQHVGIIMDGNRRWARQKGLPSLAGHKKGYGTAVRITDYAFHRGVRFLTLYAFSTENWDRSKREVGYLMRLLLTMIEEQTQKLHAKGIRLLFIGSRDRLSSRIRAAIVAAHHLTKDNKKGTLVIALNYGGRQEIIDAARSLMREGYSWKNVTMQLLGKKLNTGGIPDPDLIIRTSGEQRLSGFLLWQGAYSELYFTRRLWPAFTNGDLDLALEDYQKRKRRFGT